MENMGVELLFRPPEKVKRMFEAVSKLIAEKADLNSITVQMITERAGIGKGTAYSYFSSREELIVVALFYDYGKLLQELEIILKQTEGFRDKMHRILDWLHGHGEYHMTFIQMLRVCIGSEKRLCDVNSGRFNNLLDGMKEYMTSRIDYLMEQGFCEGDFIQTDIIRRRMAFATMILQVAMTFGEKSEKSFFPMPYEEVREYAYEGMIKMLS